MSSVSSSIRRHASPGNPVSLAGWQHAPGPEKIACTIHSLPSRSPGRGADSGFNEATRSGTMWLDLTSGGNRGADRQGHLIMHYVCVVEHHSGPDRPRRDAKVFTSRNVTATGWRVASRRARNSGSFFTQLRANTPSPRRSDWKETAR